MGNKLEVPTVDLSGKVAVVTGGNTGIGYEVVKALAEMGAHTFMACRSEERATTAITRMKQTVGPQKVLNVEYLPLDLASFQSTKDFVRSFKEKNLPLHILINNAAVAWVPFSRTVDLNEMHYQVNHLSPLLLTLELSPIILETASTSGDGRILFVSSAAHTRGFGGEFIPENLNSEVEYNRWKTYSRTKLYNILTTYAFQRRLQNVSVTVSAQEPGYVKTELSRGWSEDKPVLAFINSIGYATIARTPKEGAATILNCAVNPELNSQQALYYSSCRPANSSPDSRNEEYQEELWRRSIDILRDHLSPEILEKYGASSSAGGEEEGEEVEGAAEPDVTMETGQSGEEVTVDKRDQPDEEHGNKPNDEPQKDDI